MVNDSEKQKLIDLSKLVRKELDSLRGMEAEHPALVKFLESVLAMLSNLGI